MDLILFHKINQVKIKTWELKSDSESRGISPLAQDLVSIFPNKVSSLDLFNSHFSKEVYLIKEFKEADYFIKSSDQKDHYEIINNIRKIPEISIIYNLNSNEIKNKENLIFD